MAEYEKEFSRLSKYASESVLMEKFRCGQFEEGLHESIKRYLTAVTSLQVVNFYQLVQAAIKIEKSKMKSQERKKEKKLSNGGSCSGKRPRESQVDSVQGSTIRGRETKTYHDTKFRSRHLHWIRGKTCMPTLPQIS